MTTGSELLRTRSKLASDPKYNAQLEVAIPDLDQILLADDSEISEWDFDRFKLRYNRVLVVLTTDRFVIFPKDGLLKKASPRVIPLGRLTRSAPWNVQPGLLVESDGGAYSCVLSLGGDQTLVDHWVATILQALQAMTDAGQE